MLLPPSQQVVDLIRNEQLIGLNENELFPFGIEGVAVSPDQQTVVVSRANEVLELYSTQNWQLMRSIQLHRLLSTKKDATVCTKRNLEFVDNKHLVLTNFDGQEKHELVLLDLKEEKIVRRLDTHAGFAFCMAVQLDKITTGVSPEKTVVAAKSKPEAEKKPKKEKKAKKAKKQPVNSKIVEDIMAYKNSIWTQAVGNL